jgi:hypothetical protein
MLRLKKTLIQLHSIPFYKYMIEYSRLYKWSARVQNIGGDCFALQNSQVSQRQIDGELYTVFLL